MNMVTILDENAIARAVRRLASEAAEQSGGTANLALIGIRTRGVILARRLQREILRQEGAEVPLGILDIALYRDDLLSGNCDAVFKGSEINFDIEGKRIVLCDDVLYTGRTVRAALAALSSLGRAESVRLVCLIDRGHRELTFRADCVGKNVPTSRDEKVVVHFKETDGEDNVYLLKKADTN